MTTHAINTAAPALTATPELPPGGPALGRPIRGRIRRPDDQVRMTRVGLIIPAEMAYDDWAHAGEQLSGIMDSSAWCLGDWLVYGKKHYSDRYQYAIRAAGLQYQTLRNYAWVSRRFDLDRRRSLLSFQHHAEVASIPLEEQDQWLDEAEQHKWTTKQLRRRLQEGRGGLAALPQSGEIPRIQVIGSRLSRWRHAAEYSGVKFDHWVVSALDTAAEQTLGTPAIAEA